VEYDYDEGESDSSGDQGDTEDILDRCDIMTVTSTYPREDMGRKAHAILFLYIAHAVNNPEKSREEVEALKPLLEVMSNVRVAGQREKSHLCMAYPIN